MTPEDKIKIEQLRTSTLSTDINWLRAIYKNETGQTLDGCLCKSSNVTRIRTQFYNWFDSIKPNTPTDEN